MAMPRVSLGLSLLLSVVMDQLLVGVIVASLIAALLLSRWRSSWLFAAAMLACYLFGVVDERVLLSKATNEGLITLILLILVSVGLERLPWLSSLSQRLIVPSLATSISRLALITAAFSAFVNNTAVVTTLATSVRKNRYHAASRLLLPLSYAAILGGTLTLIGTSTNLIVSSFLQDVSGEGIAFFAFLPVALPAALAGIVVMVVVRRRLPDHGEADLVIEDYLVEAEVQPGSAMIGNSVFENGLRELGELFLVEIVRNGNLISPVAPTDRLQANDKLIFSGDVSKVSKLDRFDGLKLYAVDEGLMSSNMTEVVLLPGASVVGRTLKDSGFRARFDAAVVGVKRGGQRLSGQLGSLVLQAGDSMMLATGPDFRARSNLRRNFMVVDDRIEGAKLPLGISVFITVALFGAVTLAALGQLPLIKGLVFILAAMLALGVVVGRELRRRFPFDMWLIVSSALVLSQAMTDTGLVKSLLLALEPVLVGVPGLWTLVAIYILTLMLTELMTNNAAAALMFPLAYATALDMGVDPMAFIMAVAFGASASFLTPFGYTTNLMVQNLGGYRRRDYWRFGWPVSLVYSATVLMLIPRVFPL